MSNRLKDSTSAYLKSAAHQPIDWHEFGEEAFALARDLDRPILLDIGAVWCHWCHVIDRESYDDPEIAELINKHYVAIKVDRDQRPDVDARYQQVVQAMSGQGGWPLTGFLTYDGRLIYGGTYFPPTAMKSLLTHIQEIYHTRKADIFVEGDMLTEETIRRMEESDRSAAGQVGLTETVSPVALRALSENFLDTALKTIHRAYDPTHGGFGDQPKFPHFSALALMIGHVYENPDAQDILQMLEKTLSEMARGGIYDQIAGGFHRYSVDDHWHVPHFEKMAYDNAEALTVYAQAARLTHNPFFREIAEGIIGWVGETLSDPKHGGFYASQDADIDLNDDGDHFTWSPEEVAEILTQEEVAVANRYYNIHAQGDMHHAKGRNVLYVSRPLTDIAQELSLPLEQVESLLASAKAKMLEKRRNRPMPFVDQNLYVNWNGMMIAAWFEAADLLDLPDAREFADKSLERILSSFYRKHEQVEHATGVEGFLDDYAWLALAAIKGYGSTGNKYYLAVAQDIADMMLARFEDERLGGFYDTAKHDRAIGLLKLRRKPAEDSPSSSANAIALRVLNALFYFTARENYRASFEKGLNTLIHTSSNYGLFVAALGVTAMNYINPPLKLEVAGRSHDLQTAARCIFHPGKLISYAPDETQDEVRICVGTQCLAPVRNAETLATEVKTLCNPASTAAI